MLDSDAYRDHVTREMAQEPGRLHLALHAAAPLRSPAPEPAPDHGEQLVAVRAAIASFRAQAMLWRRSTFVDKGAHYDRRADVLEHVLRRLIAEGGDGE